MNKYYKKTILLIMIIFLAYSSNAAIVSDNDGAAFITKNEFDSLKNSFQDQIDQYNQSIDKKIDGAISSYLSGMSLTSEESLSYLLADSKYSRDIKFRESWQKLCPGAWNNYAKAAFCILEYNMESGEYTYGMQYRYLNTGLAGLAASYVNSRVNVGGVWTEMKNNSLWMFNDIDSCEHASAATRFAFAKNTNMYNYYQKLFIEREDIQWHAGHAGSKVYLNDIYPNYTGSGPGFIDYSFSASDKNTINTRFLADEVCTDIVKVGSSEWPTIGTTSVADCVYQIGGKIPTGDKVLGIVKDKMSDWEMSGFLNNILIQNGGKNTTGAVQTSGPGVEGTPSGKAHGRYCVNFIWSSNGPQRIDLPVTDLVNENLTKAINNDYDVHYYSGIPVCILERPGKVSMKVKLNVDNPAGYTDVSTTFAVNGEPFKNLEFTDNDTVETSKQYKEVIDYYKENFYSETDIVARGYEIVEVDYSELPLKNFPMYVWVKLKPNHGANNTRKEKLVTVEPEFLSINFKVDS